MARVPYPDPDRLLPETQAALAQLPALNIFAMLAGGEGVLRTFTRLGNHLLFKSSLDPMLRELAILRVGALSDASYEVHQHEAIARRLGMSDELIAAVRAEPGRSRLRRDVATRRCGSPTTSSPTSVPAMTRSSRCVTA
ncbi:MAG: carboxymuconolactone decarboxylase family protein [Ilumatobacteraceae bacterium]